LIANQVPLRNGSDALQVNWLELVISNEDTGQILYQNSFVTNHKITVANVTQLAQVGRTRWKIENNTALAGCARGTTIPSKPRAITWNTTSGMDNKI
jgi:hypothetical protein